MALIEAGELTINTDYLIYSQTSKDEPGTLRISLFPGDKFELTGDIAERVQRQIAEEVGRRAKIREASSSGGVVAPLDPKTGIVLGSWTGQNVIRP